MTQKNTPHTVGHVGWSPDYKSTLTLPVTGKLIDSRSAAAETVQIGSDSAVAHERFVRRWGGADYPIIARLVDTYDLVAHPNGPALCDGDCMSSIDTHPDDSREIMMLKMKAQAAWREYAWPLVKENFYPTKQWT